MAALSYNLGTSPVAARGAFKRLELVHDAAPAKAVRPVSRSMKKQRTRIDTVCLIMALAAVLAFFVVAGVRSLVSAVQVPYPTPTVVVRVASGDTLWKYASKYGDPNDYILDRMEQICQANKLGTQAILRPGQRLTIPVTNPVLAAQIRSNATRLASAESGHSL